MEPKFNQDRLNVAVTNFIEYAKGPKYLEDLKQRELHTTNFKKLMSQPFDEVVLSNLIKSLWSMQIWGNKDYVTDNIIEKNGIDNIKKEFSRLVDTSRPIEDRYFEFVTNVKKMGTSSVTEILCHLQPNDAAIWNSVARKSLAWLEVTGVNTNEWRLNKEEYKQFNFIAKYLEKLLKDSGIKADLLIVDYFLWETNSKLVKEGEISNKPQPPTKSLTRHEEIKSEIASIGAFLGFYVETEEKLSPGCVVDVIWSTKIGNLGKVSYVLEVQSKGSIDSLILNLQKAQVDNTVQKLVIVSDFEQLEKIRKEIEDLPESFKKRCVFWSDEEVDSTFEHLQEVYKSTSSLHLVEE